MPDLPALVLGAMRAIVYLGSAFVYAGVVTVGCLFIACGLLALFRPTVVQRLFLEHVVPLTWWNPFRAFWESPQFLLILPASGVLIALIGSVLLVAVTFG